MESIALTEDYHGDAVRFPVRKKTRIPSLRVQCNWRTLDGKFPILEDVSGERSPFCLQSALWGLLNLSPLLVVVRFLCTSGPAVASVLSRPRSLRRIPN
jgi:hypothetical protein